MAKIEDGWDCPIRHSTPSGSFPFCLGTFLAWRLDHVFNLPVFVLGIIGIVMVMLSTYHAGEYFAHDGG